MNVGSSKSLGAVALAAGSMVAGMGSAQASVVTTYVGQGAPGSLTLFSFDGDPAYTLDSGVINALGSHPAVVSNVIAGQYVGLTEPIKYLAGASIGPGAFALPISTGVYDSSGNKGDIFLGLDIITGGDTSNFGYVEIDANELVVGYAFETTSGTAIVTADIPPPVLAAVPEPATLALLAAGLAGVAGIRRRNRRDSALRA